jgi:putative ABC transport system permease protein
MPDWNRIVQQRMAALRLEPVAEARLTEELAQHLEDHYADLLARGLSEGEAYQETVRELANMQAMRTMERGRRRAASDAAPAGSGSGNFFPDLWNDLRYAGRTMRKNRLFALFVILTLGLGIGANTTVFTVVNTLILNPLPVPDSSRLAAVAMAESKTTSKTAAPLPISYPNLKDYQAANEVFTSLAGYTSPRLLTLQSRGGPEHIFAELVTGNYFSTLGIRPALGRFFLPGEDSAPGAHPVAVLNYATWQQRFGGAPDIIGRTLRVNDLIFTVVGVGPPHFIGLNAIFGPDLWIPAAMTERLLPNEMGQALSARSKGVFQGVGRLRPGISRSRAQADLAAIAAGLARQYPEVNKGHTATVRPIADVLFVSNGGSIPVRFVGALLLLVTGIVLLIACSNVANLLLARAAARRQEIAVRLAIGASRARLIRQLLTESMLLGLLAGGAGLLMGYAGIQLLWFNRWEVAANLVAPRLDPAVFIYTLAVSLMAGLAFGIIPAMRAAAIGSAEALKEEARSIGASRHRISLANVLLGGQVALSFLLLVMAGLFLRSIGRAYVIDPGFQTAHLATFMTNPGQAGYDKPRTKAFYKEVSQRVAALPGIQSAAWASNVPLWGQAVSGLQVEGRAQRSKADTISSIVNTVGLDYFETAGVRIDRGRAFTEMDREDSAPVAIVNEKLAQDYWPGQSALGKRIGLPGEKIMRQVVGVARTVNYSNVGEAPQRCVYVPLEQRYSDAMILYIRSQGDPGPLLLAVEHEIRAAGPGVSVDFIRTGRRIIEDNLFQAKMGVTLLSVFGLLALGLAGIGLYGIMAYAVNCRTREIGVRMALGATPASVLRLMLRRGMSLVAAGVLLGGSAAWAAGRLLSRMLYGVSAGDPLSFAGAALVLVAVALAACYLPARRASRLDPLAALRQE